MQKSAVLTPEEIADLDRFYREGGLRQMTSPHVHYAHGVCPRAGCGHALEWIDFQLEPFGDPEGVYKPLVKSWWEGKGFAGLCPSCGGWIKFTTLRMDALSDEDAATLPKLPKGGRVCT